MTSDKFSKHFNHHGHGQRWLDQPQESPSTQHRHKKHGQGQLQSWNNPFILHSLKDQKHANIERKGKLQRILALRASPVLQALKALGHHKQQGITSNRASQATGHHKQQGITSNRASPSSRGIPEMTAMGPSDSTTTRVFGTHEGTSGLQTKKHLLKTIRHPMASETRGRAASTLEVQNNYFYVHYSHGLETYEDDEGGQASGHFGFAYITGVASKQHHSQQGHVGKSGTGKLNKHAGLHHSTSRESRAGTTRQGRRNNKGFSAMSTTCVGAAVLGQELFLEGLDGLNFDKGIHGPAFPARL
ncbi:hypothetical protein B0T11DRAFT_297426 [Plectosphaerella cucumerina]|uniref:Uncharacterized protein n=1 Tax=Plectosphaerella cucumerina TaxID=40658 RepID=A0A8K0X380_9PEZI|nr:hypothetical protein B0T11DRAFT_297426 [Plectosphaerella cucumerina]